MASSVSVITLSQILQTDRSSNKMAILVFRHLSHDSVCNRETDIVYGGYVLPYFS